MHDDQDTRRKGRLSREDMTVIESSRLYRKRVLVVGWDVSTWMLRWRLASCMEGITGMSCTIVVIRDRRFLGTPSGSVIGRRDQPDHIERLSSECGFINGRRSGRHAECKRPSPSGG